MKRSLGDRPVRAKVRATRAPVSVSSPSPRRRAASTSAAGERLAATSRRGVRPAALKSSDAGVPANVEAMQETILSPQTDWIWAATSEWPAEHAGIIGGIVPELAYCSFPWRHQPVNGRLQPGRAHFLAFPHSRPFLADQTQVDVVAIGDQQCFDVHL